MRLSSGCRFAERLITDDFGKIQSHYRAPKYPILLCHGLLGFSFITLPTGQKISYFNGVKEALEDHGAHVYALSVPPMASIQLRAKSLCRRLLKSKKMHQWEKINILAHSMGGLDSRYMISKLLTPSSSLQVTSLTTLSTPHRGSPIADMFDTLTRHFPKNYGAFTQLTTDYMTNDFNVNTPDVDTVRYFSYGAKCHPSLLSPFYIPSKIIYRAEGDNDGMVSVESAKWGEYLGTLDNVDHGDIINMTQFKPRRILNHKYSSQAMYLSIMDKLAALGF